MLIFVMSVAGTTAISMGYKNQSAAYGRIMPNTSSSLISTAFTE